MNINDQMRELATVGGREYTPSIETISSLLQKTRRARAARQSTATIAGTMGAMALGLAAAQAYSAAKDDPAFRDRNIIDNKDGLSPIEQYHAKFGKDNPTRSLESKVDLSSIIDKLKASANAGGGKPGTQPGSQPAKPGTSTPTKPAGSGGTKPSTPPVDPYAQCKKDHPAYEGATFDCATETWTAAPGYFMFGNGHIYKAVNWTDSATGLSALGNWSGTSYGWETKAIQVSPGANYYSEKVYMGGNATWTGSTCTGVTKFKSTWNATMQASCMTKSQVAATGMDFQWDGERAWVLLEANKKWHDCTNQYEDINNPPEGWTWNGSGWVETVPSP